MKTSTRLAQLRAAFVMACVIALTISLSASADIPSRVFLNGVPTPVYFNDGDSFRVLSGALAGSRARLAGFNTLESYGRAHQWGTWTRTELAHYATLGTLNARRGVWHCTSDMKRDGYGRTLWNCPDLSIDQVRKGYAHAMSVKGDAHPDVVEAQKEAIRYRRGIWSHGVPKYVLTSLHSISENYKGKNYNRLVHSVTGASKKWYHQEHYDECQTACAPLPDQADMDKISAFISTIRSDSAAASVFEGLSDEEFAAVLKQYVETGITGDLPGDRFEMEAIMSQAVSAGWLNTTGEPVACMVYAQFKRRYGRTKAQCL
ncbi:MAG: hypothetical protein VX223_05885 [Myxococcota bacterium]|nr:hypothetical protein [Myxococcota bacterium]